MRAALLASLLLGLGPGTTCGWDRDDRPDSLGTPEQPVEPAEPGQPAEPGGGEHLQAARTWLQAMSQRLLGTEDDEPPAGPATVGATASGAWYDARPLLASLREPEARALSSVLGGVSLNEMTLYDMDVHIDIEEARFRVDETIWFTNRTKAVLEGIPMRVFVNDVGPESGPQVALTAGHCEPVDCDVQWDERSLLFAKLARPLPPGGRVRIHVEATGTFQRLGEERMDFMAQGMEGLSSMAGMGAKSGDYGLVSVCQGTASLASFFPVVARYRKGRWVTKNRSTMGDLGTDELSHYQVRVHTEPDVRVFAVGRIMPTSTTRRTDIVAGAVRDFTVLASRTLKTASAPVDDIVVRSHYLPAHERAGLRVLRAAHRSLTLFQKQFGRYPYRDLDVVEAPLIGGAGGVEFSGLVTVATMFYRKVDMSKLGGLPGGMTINGKQGANPLSGMVDRMLEFVTVHEVAHQYWHGLVGSDSRLHPFADEGLAQFSSILYLQKTASDERARADIDMQVAMNYRTMRMMGKQDGPVDRAVAEFSSPVEYAGLVYGKGPLMYLKLRDELGASTFDSELRKYVDRYRFRIAPGNGFVEAIAESHARQARPLIRHWLHEAHGDNDVGGDWNVPGMPGIKASEMKDMMDLLKGLKQGDEMPAGLPGDAQELLKALQEPTVDG